MALIKSLNRVNRSRRVHNETYAEFDVFNDDKKKYLQIDTFGSNNRQDIGKVSQSIQMDEKSAKQLLEIIKKEFGI